MHFVLRGALKKAGALLLLGYHNSKFVILVIELSACNISTQFFYLEACIFEFVFQLFKAEILEPVVNGFNLAAFWKNAVFVQRYGVTVILERIDVSVIVFRMPKVIELIFLTKARFLAL